jgi:hypothetical protein
VKSLQAVLTQINAPYKDDGALNNTKELTFPKNIIDL